jgi:hypothetical protein
MYYSIQATITETDHDGITVRDVPTFYLHKNVQGIENVQQAEVVARTILSIGLKPNCKIEIFAMLIE